MHAYQDFIQLFVVHWLDDVVRYLADIFCPFYVGLVDGGGDYVQVNFLFQPGFKLRVLLQKIPAVHHGHVNIQKYDIWQLLMAVCYQVEIFYGVVAVFEGLDLIGNVSFLDFLFDHILVYIVIVHDIHDLKFFLHLS